MRVSLLASGATLNGTVSAAWTATAGTTNSGTATLTTAGFAVNLAAVTGGSVGYSVTNTAATATMLARSGTAAGRPGDEVEPQLTVVEIGERVVAEQVGDNLAIV